MIDRVGIGHGKIQLAAGSLQLADVLTRHYALSTRHSKMTRCRGDKARQGLEV